MSIEDEIALGLNSLEIEAELDKFAHEVADYAKDLAPVFDPERDRRATPGIGEPEDFKNSIRVLPGGPVGHRRVGSDFDPIALWQEVGTRHMPEYAVFAKTASYFGGSGPIIDEGVQHAQKNLRGELEKLEKMAAEGAAAHHIASQSRAVNQARLARSAAFRAARGGRGRRRSR